MFYQTDCFIIKVPVFYWAIKLCHAKSSFRLCATDTCDRRYAPLSSEVGRNSNVINYEVSNGTFTRNKPSISINFKCMGCTFGFDLKSFLGRCQFLRIGNGSTIARRNNRKFEQFDGRRACAQIWHHARPNHFVCFSRQNLVLIPNVQRQRDFTILNDQRGHFV